MRALDGFKEPCPASADYFALNRLRDESAPISFELIHFVQEGRGQSDGDTLASWHKTSMTIDMIILQAKYEAPVANVSYGRTCLSALAARSRAASTSGPAGTRMLNSSSSTCLISAPLVSVRRSVTPAGKCVARSAPRSA